MKRSTMAKIIVLFLLALTQTNCSLHGAEVSFQGPKDAAWDVPATEFTQPVSLPDALPATLPETMPATSAGQDNASGSGSLKGSGADSELLIYSPDELDSLIIPSVGLIAQDAPMPESSTTSDINSNQEVSSENSQVEIVIADEENVNSQDMDEVTATVVTEPGAEVIITLPSGESGPMGTCHHGGDYEVRLNTSKCFGFEKHVPKHGKHFRAHLSREFFKQVFKINKKIRKLQVKVGKACKDTHKAERKGNHDGRHEDRKETEREKDHDDQEGDHDKDDHDQQGDRK